MCHLIGDNFHLNLDLTHLFIIFLLSIFALLLNLPGDDDVRTPGTHLLLLNYIEFIIIDDIIDHSV